MGLRVKGLRDFEDLAARRFDKTLRLSLKHHGLNVEIIRLSSSIPQHEGILINHNQDAADMYQIGTGLGQLDVIENAGDFEINDGVERFNGRIVASHHIYASTDGFTLMDFEEVFFFTLSDILPDDTLKFIRPLDNLVRTYRVMEVELVGTAQTSGKRLKMSALQDEINPILD